MNLTTENIAAQELAIIIEIEASDYQPAAEAELKKYRQSANIPGFRPGKVPMGMIKKMYGQSVTVETINKLVSEELDKYIKENNVQYLGEPIINDDKTEIDWENENATQKFYFELGLKPEFSLENVKFKAIKYYKIEADEKEIEEEIDNMRKRYGAVSDVEESVDGDLLVGTYIFKGEEMEAVNSSIFIDAIDDKKIKESFIGKKAEDVVSFDIKKAYKDENYIARVLGVKVEDIDPEKTKIDFTIKTITHLEMAPIDEELFNKVYPDGSVKTEEEFRNKIKESIEQNFVQHSEKQFVEEAVNEVMEKVDVSLPADFLKRWMRKTSQEINDENVDQEYEKMEKSVKWQLIENEIARNNDINVEVSDVRNYIKEFYKGYLAQISETEGEEEANKRLEGIADEAMKNQEDVRKIYEMLFDQRITAAIKNMIKPKETPISFEKFNKLGEK
ncbi:MAG: trigger factor [Bacteroidales bacterium]